MTIKDCIDIVDNLKPNQYTIKDKVMWISFIEEIIINEVLKTHEGYDGRYDDFNGYSEDKISVTLIVPSPYDRLYTAYLKMKIDESNGETARYNNSALLYNTYMSEYRKYYNKTHMPLNITGTRDVIPPIRPTVGLSDAEYENIKKDIVNALTEKLNGMVSPDILYDIVNKFVQNNIEMLKGKDGRDGVDGKDGYTPQKNIDYFDGARGKAFTYSDFTHEQLEALKGEKGDKGGTGVRSGEDTDNSKYYSNIAKSEAVNAKDIMTNSEEILEYVRLHGVYTAFSVNYETGEVEYVSPSFKFNINMETGELDAIGQTYSFDDEVGRIVEEWLEANHININTLQDISLTHSGEIKELQELTENHSAALNSPRPIRLGGTGAVTAREAIENLGATQIINGSYVGTGTYGENNPNTLTFVDENGDAVIPKVVMIGCIGNHRPPAIYYWGNPGFSMVSSMISLNAGSSSFNNNAFYDYPNVVGINDNTMTWFCRNSESAQLNASGSTYYFLALI